MNTLFTRGEANELSNNLSSKDGSKWIIARPYNYRGLKWKIKAAWNVLIGKAFPIEWL